MSMHRICAASLVMLQLAAVAVAGPAERPRLASGSAEAARREASRPDAPRGVPGFYDPSTGAFTPLQRLTRQPAKVVHGAVGFTIRIRAEAGVGPNDAVSCDLELSFGAVAGEPGVFFADHAVRKTIRFMAGEARVDDVLPFAYAPNGAGKPQLLAGVLCRIPAASDGRAHAGGRFGPAEDIVDDVISKTYDIRL